MNYSGACLSSAIHRSESLSIQELGSMGVGRSQHPRMVDRINWHILMMLLIISPPSFLYPMIEFIYNTFIDISFSASFEFLALNTHHCLNHDMMAIHCFSSSSSFGTRMGKLSIDTGDLDDNSESDDQPLWWPSMKAMGKQLSYGPFPWMLGKQVMATQLTPIWVESLHREQYEVYDILQGEVEWQHVPQASQQVVDWVYKWLNLPANIYIYRRKNLNEAGEYLVGWKVGNLWRHELFGDSVTGLIISAEYNAQSTHSGDLVMVMAAGNDIPINYVMFVNHFGMNAVKTALICSWWYEEIARIDPAQRNSDPPHAYISVVNKSFQRLFPSLALCIRLFQIVLPSMPQCYSAAWLRLTPFTDFKHSQLQRSRNLYHGYQPRTALHSSQSCIK